MKLHVLVILSVALWVSALTMLFIGLTVDGLSILKLVAIPDAVLAIVFTFLAARKWVGG